MNATDSDWDLTVLQGQGNILEPQQHDSDLEQATYNNNFLTAPGWLHYGGNIQNIPRNVVQQPQQLTWLSPPAIDVSVLHLSVMPLRYLVSRHSIYPPSSVRGTLLAQTTDAHFP